MMMIGVGTLFRGTFLIIVVEPVALFLVGTDVEVGGIELFMDAETAIFVSESPPQAITAFKKKLIKNVILYIGFMLLISSTVLTIKPFNFLQEMH